MKARRFAIIGNLADSMLNFRGPLIADIAARGVEVFALAPDYAEGTRAAVRQLGATPIDYPLSRAGMNPFHDLGDFLRLSVILGGLKLDGVLAAAIKPVIYGTLAACLARVPQRFAMIEGLGYAFIEQKGEQRSHGLVQGTAKLLYRLALERASKVFFLNPDDLADFGRWRLVDLSRASVIGGIGVDLEAWPQTAPATAPITFTLAARLIRDKGVLEYVEAARRIKARHPEVRFLLLGGLDANPAAISAREVERWVETGVIEWPGHVPMRPWLAQTSVFVLPSYREGVPRSTQEAMALGRPIVTTDAPGCRETVIEGRNGFLVPPRDVGALTDAMDRFITAPQLIAEMGAASRSLAEQRFDVRKVNARMIAEMDPAGDAGSKQG